MKTVYHIGCLLAGLLLLSGGRPAMAQEQEVRLHFYLYCDDREDPSIGQATDEIYLFSTYMSNNGLGHIVHTAPKDFRDGGDQERKRDYNNLIRTTLRPGEYLSATISVMEDDSDALSKLLRFHAAALDTMAGYLKTVPDPRAQAAAVGAEHAAKHVKLIDETLVSKGHDKLATVQVFIRNADGKLETTITPDGHGADVVDRERRLTKGANGGHIDMTAFRVVGNGYNYHMAVWQGDVQSNEGGHVSNLGSELTKVR
jgi:hypothetical protein